VAQATRALLRWADLSAAAVFTIWVAASQVAAPSTAAMAAAAGELLGPSVRIRTQTFPDESPGAARPPEPGERSATLSWDSGRHEHARLVLCRAAGDCVDRWVAFDESDPELERGRTLGFLAATVFLDSSPSVATKPPPPAALPPPPPPHPFPRGELTAAVAASGPGEATAFGASLGGDYASSRAFRLGLAAEVRFGELDRARASSRIASLVARTTWVAFRPEANVWLGLGVGVGGYQLSLSHFSSDDKTPDRQARILFGGTAGVLAGLDFSEESTLYLELAGEVLSGKPTVFVHEEPRAVWPIVSPVARLGLRAGF
jgi:hypothetical protein